MKLEPGDLVAINFYDDQGDATKKRALGKVVVGLQNSPGQVFCKVELIYPISCKGTQIGVRLSDLRVLVSQFESKTIVWEEVVLSLARGLDGEWSPRSEVVPEPPQPPPAVSLPPSTEVKKELIVSDFPKPPVPNMVSPVTEPDENYFTPFTVALEHPAIGKFCQVCTEKIKVGEKVRERKARSILNSVSADSNLKFYEHAGGCSFKGGTSDFGQGTGGGNRVIRSTRSFGG